MSLQELHHGTPAVHAKDAKEWRRWLLKHHRTARSVWLIIRHKGTAPPSVRYDEAVEQALCFGWIDSVAHKRDADSKYQFFARRKPKSNWSRANRERADRMIRTGQMTESGQALIDAAKASGAWTALEDAQNSVIPEDLQYAFKKNKIALTQFLAFPPSSKRIILEWILNAKKPETRRKRIHETVSLAAKNIRANHYRQ